VAQSTQGAVDRVLHDRESQSAKADEPSDGEREWLSKAVWFQDWAGINQYGVVVSTWSVALRGVQREVLSGASFYDAIERPDLAAAYRRKLPLRIGLIAGGAALMVASLGTMTWGLLNLGFSEPKATTVGDVSYAYPNSSPGATPWIATVTPSRSRSSARRTPSTMPRKMPSAVTGLGSPEAPVWPSRPAT
jgi:hypothetical protein